MYTTAFIENELFLVQSMAQGSYLKLIFKVIFDESLLALKFENRMAFSKKYFSKRKTFTVRNFAPVFIALDTFICFFASFKFLLFTNSNLTVFFVSTYSNKYHLKLWFFARKNATKMFPLFNDPVEQFC